MFGAVYSPFRMVELDGQSRVNMLPRLKSHRRDVPLRSSMTTIPVQKWKRTVRARESSWKKQTNNMF